MIAVNDTEKLAKNLLPIAGGRMMAYLAKSPDLLEEVSRISPTLTSYLQSLSWVSLYCKLSVFLRPSERKVPLFLPGVRNN